MKEGMRVMEPDQSISLIDQGELHVTSKRPAMIGLITEQSRWKKSGQDAETINGEYQKGVELIIIVISLMVMVMAIVIFTKTNNRHSLLSSNVRRHPNAPPLCQNKCKLFKLCFLWMYCLIIGRYEGRRTPKLLSCSGELKRKTSLLAWVERDAGPDAEAVAKDRGIETSGRRF